MAKISLIRKIYIWHNQCSGHLFNGDHDLDIIPDPFNLILGGSNTYKIINRDKTNKNVYVSSEI